MDEVSVIKHLEEWFKHFHGEAATQSEKEWFVSLNMLMNEIPKVGDFCNWNTSALAKLIRRHGYTEFTLSRDSLSVRPNEEFAQILRVVEELVINHRDRLQPLLSKKESIRISDLIRLPELERQFRRIGKRHPAEQIKMVSSCANDSHYVDVVNGGNRLKLLNRDEMILRQVEHYFTDENIQQDKYFRELLLENDAAAIPIRVLCNFNRFAVMNMNVEELASILQMSTILQVDEAAGTVRCPSLELVPHDVQVPSTPSSFQVETDKDLMQELEAVLRSIVSSGKLQYDRYLRSIYEQFHWFPMSSLVKHPVLKEALLQGEVEPQDRIAVMIAVLQHCCSDIGQVYSMSERFQLREYPAFRYLQPTNDTAVTKEKLQWDCDRTFGVFHCNVLAQYLINPTDVSYCKPEYYKWKHRASLLRSEVLYYLPAIILLNEVQSLAPRLYTFNNDVDLEHPHNLHASNSDHALWFATWLHREGYECAYLQKHLEHKPFTSIQIGNMISWSSQLFEFLSYREVKFAPLCCKLAADEETRSAVSCYCQVALCVALLHRTTNRLFIIASVHIAPGVHQQGVQLLQAVVLMREVASFAQQLHRSFSTHQISFILAGDMNADESEVALQYLKGNSLADIADEDYDHYFRIWKFKELNQNAQTLRSPIPLVDANQSILKKSFPYTISTDKYHGTIDHMLYCEDVLAALSQQHNSSRPPCKRLIPVSTLMTPNTNKALLCPSSMFPSDHISLLLNFYCDEEEAEDTKNGFESPLVEHSSMLKQAAESAS